MKKQCSKCKRTRLFKFFNKDPRYRLGITGWCKDCILSFSQTPEAKKRAAARRRKWISIPANRRKEKIRSRNRYRKDPRGARDKILRLLYGVSLKRHERAKKCFLCKRTGTRLCADHNHKTGKYRGALCNPCNLMLGRIEKMYKILNRIKQYLKRGL